jgi:hypothetical protein
MDERLWQRIEAALDERRDPRADPDLARALAGAPDAAAALDRLGVGLARLDGLRRERRGRRALAFGATFAAAAVVALVLVARPEREPSSQVAHATRERVVGLTLVVVREPAPEPRGERVVLAPRRLVAWTQPGVLP